MSWLAAARLDEIPRLGARVVRVGGESIAVFRTSDDRVFALRDVCPHQGGPLSQGIVHGRCVTCPLHDWVIDLETGDAIGPDEGRTATYPVKTEDGRVFVDVSAASSRDTARSKQESRRDAAPTKTALSNAAC